jgi:hypothetical protein
MGPGALRIAHAHTNTDCNCHIDTYIHAYCNGYIYSNSDGDIHSHRAAYADGYGNVHAYSNTDCYSGNPDSDANMHTERDFVRHFERFWYRGE